MSAAVMGVSIAARPAMMATPRSVMAAITSVVWKIAAMGALTTARSVMMAIESTPTPARARAESRLAVMGLCATTLNPVCKVLRPAMMGIVWRWMPASTAALSRLAAIISFEKASRVAMMVTWIQAMAAMGCVAPKGVAMASLIAARLAMTVMIESVTAVMTHAV